MAIRNIIADLHLNIVRHEAVHGGDINQTYCLHGRDKKYFLKVNEAERYPLMFQREAEGLTALHKGCELVVPEVIDYGIVDGQQYLLMEWLEIGRPRPDMWEQFGAGLAEMHKRSQPYFGWHSDNYIGSLRQGNLKHNNWQSFYSDCRIMPLVRGLHDMGLFGKQDVLKAETLCVRFEQHFADEPPALLHGDLWCGNFMVSTKGPAIFDPAVYNGHREMDIGMTKLFGGFDGRFYEAYQQVYPLEAGWQQRLQLTQLYPLLVHAVLFGGHYVASARGIIGDHT